MAKRIAVVVLGLMLLGLQARLWVADDGVRSRQRLQLAAETAHAENRQLALRNAELDAEVQDLKSGTAAIEARARTTLGMIQPDETFFLVVQ
jgi:cell division protein FtsB